MAITQSGLPGGGTTTHYRIFYDDTLATGQSQATGLLAKCEEDYALMSSWFGGIDVTGGLPLIMVVVTATNGGASWDDGLIFEFVGLPGMHPAAIPHSVNSLRQLLVAEVSEMFMRAQGGDWFVAGSSILGIIPTSGGDEGSRGEGLSRFLGVQSLLADGIAGAVPPPTFRITPVWLNSGSRNDHITINPDDHSGNEINGCTTLFMYYLHNQLGFSINKIIAAGAHTAHLAEPGDPVPVFFGIEIPSLVGLYRNLTGRTDAWSSFISLIDNYYPTRVQPYQPAGDNLFPVADLLEIAVPAESLPRYSQLARISFNNPAMADVDIKVTSSDTSLVKFRRIGDISSSNELTVTATPGSSSSSVTIDVADIPIPVPPKHVTISATYAGKTVSATMAIVPPRLVRLDLSADVVVAGDRVVGTLFLDYALKSGSIEVAVWTGSGMASTPPNVTVGAGTRSVSFDIETPDAPIPFKPVPVVISAYYNGNYVSASLLVKSKIEAGILQSLELAPASIKGGGFVHGTAILEEAVSVETKVSLTPLEAGTGGIPGVDDVSDLVTLPSFVIVPAGHDRAGFTIKTVTLAPGIKRGVIIWGSAIVSKFATLTVTG